MEGLLTGSPARGEAARGRTFARLLYGPALTLAVGLCAALPVIAAAVRALNEGWQPVADRGIIATRAFDVFSSHTPLVGQYSFAGTVTGKLTYSLGPMLYWLLAPAARVGAPGSFVLTMAVVNAACVLGAVALARRRGGVWLMAAAAIGIAVMCRSLAANNFYDIWNPSVGLFPLLALIFVCWSLACGDYRLLPVAVLLMSFLVQLEDSFIPTSLGAFAVGLGGFALWWWRAARARPARAAPTRAGRAADASAARAQRRRPRVWPWALAGVVVLLLCWSAPLIDQVNHSGNFSLVVQAASKRKSPLGATVGVHAVIRTVGISPWWLIRPSEPFVRKYDVLHSAGALRNVSAALLLGWLALAFVLGLRRRRADVSAGAAMALMLCAGIWSIADATPNTHLLAATLGYTLWSATTVGMFAWLVALWSAVALWGAYGLPAPAVARRRGAARPAPGDGARGGPLARPALAGPGKLLAAVAALALAGAAGGAGAAAGTPDEHAFEFAALGKINSRLGAVPKGHSVFLNARLDGLITPLRPEITYDLRRRGVRALGVGAYLRTGHWYERAEHPYDYIVWVYDNGRLPVPGARLITSAQIESGGRMHTVWVAISKVKPRARSPAPGARRPRAITAVAPGLDRRDGFSAPGGLAGCAASAPLVVYPSQGPSYPTGRGAIVWARRACAGSSGAPASLVLSPLTARGRAGTRSSAALAAGAPAQLAAVGAPFGRVAIALAPAAPGGATEVLEARAGARPGVFASAGPGASPLALARAYLGDVAVATLHAGPAIAVRVQRYFRHRFGPAQLIPIAAGRVSALTVTLDYRSDVLVAWQQNGAIYARMLRSSGRSDPTQRIGASAPEPQLRALASDNDHGMVAWSQTARGGPGQPRTQVELALSAAGVRFRAPLHIATFEDPGGAGSAVGSLALVRLSTENVLMAWTDREHGRYTVRAAPAVFAASRPSARLSDPGTQAVLDDLVPGPAGEAIAVWRAARGSTAPELVQSELWAARTFIVTHDRPASSAPQLVAPAGPHTAASAGVDPASDRALIAWLSGGARPQIEYASGPANGRYRPRATPAVRPAHAGTHWLRITLAAVGGLALAAVAALLALRARGRSRMRAGR